MKTAKRKKDTKAPKGPENGSGEKKALTLDLRWMRISDLTGAPYNPRRWTPEAFARLRYSIRTLGVFQPPLYNARTKRLVAGHMRAKAAEAEGFEEIPVLVTQDYTADEEQRANLQSNNRASQGKFTRRALPLVAAIQKLHREAYTQLGLDGIQGQIEEDEAGEAEEKRTVEFNEGLRTFKIKLPLSLWNVHKRVWARAGELVKRDEVVDTELARYEKMLSSFLHAEGEPEELVEEEKEKTGKRRKGARP